MGHLNKLIDCDLLFFGHDLGHDVFHTPQALLNAQLHVLVVAYSTPARGVRFYRTDPLLNGLSRLAIGLTIFAVW